MATRQNLTSSLLTKMRFLISSSIKCQWLYQNSNAKSTKITKIEVTK